MIYQYIAPSPALQEFVRDYLIAHFIFDKDQDIPFKPYSPKPEQTITFLPKGSLTVKNPLLVKHELRQRFQSAGSRCRDIIFT